MDIFDTFIKETNSLLNSYNIKSLNSNEIWSKGNINEIIFDEDKKLRLGDEPKFGYSLILFTEDNSLLPINKVSLIGEDINKLSEYSNYVRISYILLKDVNNLSSEQLYKKLTNIDYIKYHVNLKGAMLPISVINKKESLIISKQSYNNGISFSKVGNLFNQCYLTNNNVLDVKTIFITDDNFNYSSLLNIKDKCNKVLIALDHLKNKINMDCDSCGFQVICDEVEQKIKADFKK